jgi:DNA-binding transcriptional MerR regulator
MTVNDFVIKYNGKWVEEAGTSALNQCVDLANRYIREVLGLPIIEWTNAVDFPSKAGTAYEYILNSPTNIPKEGDLIIWGGNQYGHIAIFIEGNVDSFRSFDQNYPTGSNCHIQNHTYANVKGWLRKKVSTDNTLQKDLDTCRVDRDGNHNDRIALYEELGFSGVFNRTVAVEKIRQLLALEKQFVQKDEQLRLANEKIKELEVRAKENEDKLTEFASESTRTIQTLTQENQSLLGAIQELKTTTTQPTEWSANKLIVTGIKKWLGII